MSLICSIKFIQHEFNAYILDNNYAFSDGEVLMVDSAVNLYFKPYERYFKEIKLNEKIIKRWICPYISRHLLSLNPLQAHCRRYSR
ncbi:hypothetical protein ACNIUX_16705, partial [Escherichia coli]